MLTARYIIGFTGHRAGFDETVVRAALTEVFHDLQQRVEKIRGTVELSASVAEGSDTLCVEVAGALEIPVHLVLPLPESEFAKDFSTPAAWARSEAQLRIARARPGRDSVRLAPGEPTRPDCYFNQGIYLLDAVDVLVALWDGQPARGVGGTAQIIAQAKAMGLPVIVIDAATGRVTVPGDLDARLKPDPILTELNAIATAAKTPVPAQPASPDALQACLDTIAMGESGRFRPSLVVIILAHGIAALLATIVTFKLVTPSLQDPWEKWKWVLTAAELLIVGAALWMSWRLHHKHTQQRWIRCRFACELVRGLRASIPLLDPLHPAIARHDPAWRRFALSAGLFVLAHQPTDDPVALRDRYLGQRLSDTHRDGQIRHYDKMRPKALWWWNFTGRVSAWSATLAPAFVLLSLLNKLSKYFSQTEGWHLDEKAFTWPFVVFLPIALPLIAGVASGLRHALDAGRRKDRYPEMVARLAEIRAAIPGLCTVSTIRGAVARSEEILLDELLEWQLAMKNTGH